MRSDISNVLRRLAPPIKPAFAHDCAERGHVSPQLAASVRQTWSRTLTEGLRPAAAGIPLSLVQSRPTHHGHDLSRYRWRRRAEHRVRRRTQRNSNTIALLVGADDAGENPHVC